MARVTLAELNTRVDAQGKTIYNMTSEQALIRQDIANLKKFISEYFSKDFFEKINRTCSAVEHIKDDLDKDNGKTSIKTRIRDLETYMDADIEEKKEYKLKRKQREQEEKDWKRKWFFWGVTMTASLLFGALINHIFDLIP